MEFISLMPLILAHRGFHQALPENTIAAFARAAELGFDGIETDVQLDRGDNPILFHDNWLPDGRPVSAVTRDELSDLMGYQVPLLADALDAIKDLVWDLEIKNVAAIAATEKVLRDFVDTRDIFISSFVHSAVRHLALSLGMRGALLVAHCPDGAVFPVFPSDRLITGIDTIVWDCDTVDLQVLSDATNAGIRNIVYGYRPGSAHAEILKADIEAIITDFQVPLN